jgi:hypothetical protein
MCGAEVRGGGVKFKNARASRVKTAQARAGLVCGFEVFSNSIGVSNYCSAASPTPPGFPYQLLKKLK